MNREKLEAILHYVVPPHSEDSARWLGRIKLVKLVFLIDYEAFRRQGATLTGLDYRQDLQGPMTWAIIDVANEMPCIAERTFETNAQHTGYSYTIDEADACDALQALTPEERAIVEDVYAEWGNEWWEAVLSHVHALPFVEQFERGELLDWNAFIEEKDLVMTDAARERAEARLAELRRAAARLGSSEDNAPHEWTPEGLAEMRQTLRLVSRSRSRVVERE